MKQLHKEIILGAALILFGVFCWYFLKYVFYNGNLVFGIWILGFVILTLWGIALCLAMLLIDDKRILYSSFILTLLLFYVFFNNHPIYYLIFLFLLFLAFWLASGKIKKEEEIQVNLNFWRIWKRGLPLFITILCLLIALVYYFSPGLMQTKETKIKIPQNVFNIAIKPVENLIKEQLPEGVDLDSEVSKFLPPVQLKELEKQFGIKISEGDTGRDVLYKLVDFQLSNVTGPYRKFIPFGLAIGLFITLKIVSIIYVALVILFSYLVLKLLIVLKFVRIEIETKEVETVKL